MSLTRYVNGVLALRMDDASRTVTDYTTDPPTVRDYTDEENNAADAQLGAAARLDDHESRIVRIEGHLWPAQPDPETLEEAPEWSGEWPAGGLLRDSGRVWRNVTTVPLTSRPSEFPGTPEQWSHLFVEVVIGTVDPDPDPDPVWPNWRGEWDAAATYAVGDHVSRGGIVYRCLVAHGAAYAGTWGPPTTGAWVIATAP